MCSLQPPEGGNIQMLEAAHLLLPNMQQRDGDTHIPSRWHATRHMIRMPWESVILGLQSNLKVGPGCGLFLQPLWDPEHEVYAPAKCFSQDQPSQQFPHRRQEMSSREESAQSGKTWQRSGGQLGWTPLPSLARGTNTP